MKTAIITGVSSGVGQAIVKRLQGDGWKIVGLTHAELDLIKLDEVAVVARKLSDKVSRLDALIHVAGIWHDTERALVDRDLEDFSAEQITDTMNVGVTGFMILAAGLLPKLTKTGTVIGISGTFEDGGASGWLPYYTSKRALEDFLVGLAQDYPNGPRVYGVSPSDTATAIYKKFFPEYAATAQSPEAVAELVTKLAAGELAYKSGDIIKLKDGKHAGGYHK